MASAATFSKSCSFSNGKWMTGTEVLVSSWRRKMFVEGSIFLVSFYLLDIVSWQLRIEKIKVPLSSPFQEGHRGRQRSSQEVSLVTVGQGGSLTAPGLLGQQSQPAHHVKQLHLETLTFNKWTQMKTRKTKKKLVKLMRRCFRQLSGQRCLEINVVYHHHTERGDAKDWVDVIFNYFWVLWTESKFGWDAWPID